MTGGSESSLSLTRDTSSRGRIADILTSEPVVITRLAQPQVWELGTKTDARHSWRHWTLKEEALRAVGMGLSDLADSRIVDIVSMFARPGGGAMDLHKLRLDRFHRFAVVNSPDSIDLDLDQRDDGIEVILYYVDSVGDVQKFADYC